MSKEEFMKIQTCVLKVNIHCDGCKQKVKKILQKIDGVYKTSIDSEQGKVTVSGNVDPAVLIKKLAKSGKHAELWGASKSNNNNQNHLASQFKNMQLDNGKGGNNNNKGGQKGNNNNNNQPKGGLPTPQQLQQLQQLQLQQQLQQMKMLQDLKLPQLKDMKMPPNFNQNNNSQKSVKFAEEEDFSDDDYDDDLDDDYDLDDDDSDDELDDPHHPFNKMKPMMGNAPKGMPNMMMLNGMMNGNHPQLMNAQKGAQNVAATAGGNGKKGGNSGGGGGNAVPVQVLTGGGNNEDKNRNGGKKGGGGGGGGHSNGGNQNQGGGGGKNGGALPQEIKAANNGGGGANKNGGNNGVANGGKKGNNGAANGTNDGFPSMGVPNGINMGHQMANMNMTMGQMGGLPMSKMGQMGQMGDIPAVQGLPAAAMNGAGGGGDGAGGGYFQGAGPDVMPGNPYHQQQLMAAMMNQQRAMAGNERFQPMMYARPPPAVNYMPPYPYPYPYPPPQPDPYTHFFSDDNTSSCNVM
ncbi:hypothetical protein REPUB_Repub20aG0073900 [Reevesia pubescens]